jgi:hypothetical protein
MAADVYELCTLRWRVCRQHVRPVQRLHWLPVSVTGSGWDEERHGALHTSLASEFCIRCRSLKFLCVIPYNRPLQQSSRRPTIEHARILAMFLSMS